MEKRKIIPNFWCSKEYLKSINAKLRTYLGWVWVEEDDWMIFPPVHVCWGMIKNHPWLEYENIWSDFPEYKTKSGNSEFLDYEFIYDPKEFLTMSGSKWSKFRKNVRKWPRRNGAAPYVKIDPDEQSLKSAINELLCSWLANQGKDAQIHDAETLLYYAHNAKHRAILLHPKSGILGMNIWDYNWKYINYRFILCRPEPFLDEYMRHLFYTSKEVQNSGKLVNDGGCLDNEGLKKFKETLNPVKIREVKSWKLKK